ncbi:benzoylformate decarboxylase [Arthrobacter crystallopoietes]|uniref:Benzoylformate decarboxylase n=1 Tax=Crystallibacter crystallopoietes TaxID=37928 RepID=A0A1H1D848_9MICC|nr:benzoylformate decarboxylase [Arthrobacter crystallopoietes]AUI50418.1 benzoylformate decarboxylase [Arthrobacter crystallopoietes]SDQ72701.1 benzoylformate decarboxylase [Arthrobacter crystallopoietes]
MAITKKTVLETSLDMFRAQGVTTIFGNPGSNEIPFLAGLDESFNFILGLHEQVVVGMAEGYARATGRPALVNLHAASGSGNAMGALTNAHYGHIPMVVLAGQQVRRTVGQEAMLASVDASVLPTPLVKYSHEPLAAADVPRALAQAVFETSIQPCGPVYVSVPLDDWAETALDDDALLAERSVLVAGSLTDGMAQELIATVDGAKKLALVVGPQVDAAAVEDHTVFDAVVSLAEKADASVYVAPSPSRGPFPTTHPNFEGVIVPGIKSVRDRLAGHDVVLVLGAAVFRYHRWEPSNYLEAGTRVVQITQDPREATRAPFGRSVIADVAGVAKALAGGVQDRGKRRGEPGSRELPAARTSPDGMTGTEILEVLNTYVNHTIAYVNETTTLDLDYLERIAIDRPGMYNFPASGGLGFGLPVAVGMSLGDPEKTIVATVGDGSANYGITALYTAAKQNTRTVFVIVNNSSYGALAGFAQRMGSPDIPGLELGGIDFVSIAEGYGVPAQRTSTREEFEEAYQKALKASGPVLIDAQVVMD